jgi:pimeloyl-ACP methyl ester carboxylesterase
MTGMRQRSVQCLSPAGFHDMAYVEWGDPANPRVLVCVHGLTRCGRDFDFLAAALADHYRVVCPDVVGRGRSDWLADKSLYDIPQYCADMVTLLARLDAKNVHWVGTSMGGIIGMALAARERTPITRLVLNDVGPVVTGTSIARLGEFLGNAPRFASVEEGEAYVRLVSAPFGPLTDAQWRHLTVHTLRHDADGMFSLAYDPGLAEPFRRSAGEGRDLDFWPVYDAIRCPTMVLRGAESDLLRRDTAEEMTRRGPCALLREVPGVGHAPMLLDEGQIALAREFLLAAD